MDPLVGLLRGFVVDFFTRHDLSGWQGLMEPDYELRIGDHVIRGRDEHDLPAVQAQFDQFPGIGMTVHRVVAKVDRIALHFTEHGASVRHGWRQAAWAGVALYRWNGRKLVSCSAQEDYLARRRQLVTGAVDRIDPPAPAPWDTVPEVADPAAERVVRDWLDGRGVASTDDVVFDDEHLGLAAPLRFDTTAASVLELFSAGRDVRSPLARWAATAAGWPTETRRTSS